MNLLEVKNLKVHFPVKHGMFSRVRESVKAVDDVSFSIAPGETLGLVGESGCGKSTILRALCGLNPNWSGDVTIGGEAMTPVRTRSFYRRVQMVFQDPYGSLHPNQTVDQILALPVAIHRLDRGETRIVQALAEVGLGREHRYRYPHQLSGG